jgi:hypothetical protein
MLTKLAIGFTFVLLLPWIASAASLPEGGGDPGKAYKACADAVAKPDKAGMIDLCFVKDDAWLKAKNLGYFTNETFQVEVRQEWPALRLIDVKVTGGTVNGDSADLQVEGTSILQRLEPTDEIVEVDRKPMKGTVKMKKTNNVWRYAGEQKLESPQ